MLYCLRHILCLFFLLGGLLNSSWARDRLAVLEIKASNDGGEQLKPFEVKTLTNDLRRLALEYGGFDVMTDKNILDLLPPDTKIEDCIGECEVQTGRMLGAKYIITGEVGRAGTQLDMLVQFYETTGGTLLSSKSIAGQNYEQLRQTLKQKVPSLFKGLAMRGAMIQQKSETLLFLQVSPKALSFKLKLADRYIDLNDPSIKKLDEGYLIPITPNLKRRISVVANGYMTAEEEILVSEGGVENLSIQLNRELKQESSSCTQDDKSCRADLFVYTTPIGARVYVDGRPALDEQGQQLLTEVGNPDQPNVGMVRLTLKPGEHLIEARKPRFVSAQRRVRLKKGDWHQDMQAQPLQLKEDFGRLIIEVEPKSAVIEIDGELVGQRAPLTLNEAEVGAHKLKLIAPEYLPYEEVVVVQRGQDKHLKVQLTPAFSHLKLMVSEPSGKAIKGALVNIDSLGRKGQKYTDEQGQVSYDRLPKGEYLALISHRLYSSSKLLISSKSGGQTQSLNQSLQPNYGYLSIKAPDDPKETYAKKPVQAQVYLSNGQSLGTLPLSRLQLPAGRQRLRIQPKDSERYTPQELQVTVGIGEESKLKAKLAPRIGDVVIETKPFGAEIWVNGEQWGRAPLKRTLLRGSYTLQVNMRDYDTFTQDFEVIENERIEVKVNLGQHPVLTIRCHPTQAEVWVDGLPKGRSPQTHSARAGEWLIECHHRGAVYQQRERTKDGEVRTVHLTIPQNSLDAERSKTNFIRAMAWGLVGSAGLVTLGSGAIYLGPAAQEAEQRDQAYQRFLGATPAQYDDRFSEFQRLDRSVSKYNDMNQTLLWSSLGLGLAGGALLWLVPPAEPEVPSSTSSSIKQVKAFKPTPNPLARFKAKGVTQ